MFESARHLGERAVREIDGSEPNAGADRERIELAFRLCFARTPTDREVSLLNQYLIQSRGRFSTEPEAWTALARVLINLDEFITRE
jgi:hypothetical protein